MAHKKVKNKEVKQASVMMRKMIVYQDCAMIGYGWVLINGPMVVHPPALFDIKGEPLPFGMYELRMTDEAQLVIIAGSVQ